MYEDIRSPTFPVVLYILIYSAVPILYNLLFLCIVINSEHRIHSNQEYIDLDDSVVLSKLGSGCYGVDRRCGVAEVKGVAELLGYGVEWRSGVGEVQS